MTSQSKPETMRILHSGSIAASVGGPAMSTYLALYGLRQQGVEAEIIQYPLADGDVLRGNNVPIHYASPHWGTPFQFAPKLKKEILSLGSYDIYHAQGIWLWHTYSLVDAAKKAGKPYLISPRGMLYPQDIAKSSTFFKKLSLLLRLLSDLNHAACVHATCEEEMMHCRNLGITAPICVIPNPVEIKEYLPPINDGIRRIGYLGRVSRRKNIHGLIQAYIAQGETAKGSELLIIGDGDKTYMRELQFMAQSVRYGNIKFAGFLNGNEKDHALAICSVLAMPSEFENLGNVILEGLVRRIPCIATTGSPWQELITHKCGWWIKPEQASIADALRQALQSSEAELTYMGKNGRQLVKQKYSMESIAAQMQEVYEWVITKKSPPSFIYT